MALLLAGLMQMIDQGEQDDKIIGVHADDPEYKEYNDISELPSHRLAEIKRCSLMTCSVIAAVCCQHVLSWFLVKDCCVRHTVPAA